jgi:hypothetical protein
MSYPQHLEELKQKIALFEQSIGVQNELLFRDIAESNFDTTRAAKFQQDNQLVVLTLLVFGVKKKHIFCKDTTVAEIRKSLRFDYDYDDVGLCDPASNPIDDACTAIGISELEYIQWND